ncbi:MAG: hypothetical protein QXI33_01100 [Candidatus Pacearchaeota archaeon]
MGRIKPPKPLEFRVLATPESVKPSSDKMKVIGVFNPGVSVYKNETIFMLRVTEMPIEDGILLPYFNVNGSLNSPFEILVDKLNKNQIKKEYRDSVFLKKERYSRLKHISYPIIARSSDGLTIDSIEESPGFYPCYEHERFGIEDVRITKVTTQAGQEDIYAFTYVSPHRKYGVSTSMATTLDFKKFRRFELQGKPRPIRIMIKDFSIFPEKVRSPELKKDELENYKIDYAALTRPNAFSDISNPGIWISYSDNLLYWGGSERLIGSDNGEFSGTGTPVIKIDNLWFAVYHEVNPKIRKKYGKERFFPYKAKILGLDYKNPSKLLYKSDVLINPNEHGLAHGFRPNTVYPTGIVRREPEGVIDIYSGEDDSYTSVRRYYEEDLLRFLKKSSNI